MATAFQRAADRLFDNQDMGVDGTFTVAGGSAVAVRFIVTGIDREQFMGAVAARNPGFKVAVRISEVPLRPKRGDTLTFNGSTYTVVDARLDTLGICWDIDPQ